VLVSACAAILANFLRVFIVVYLGYATDMQHPWVHDHLYLGWYLFGGLVVVLLFIDARMIRHQPLSNTEKAPANSAVAALDGQVELSRYAKASVLSALVLAIGPAAVYYVNNQPDVLLNENTFALPSGRDGWTVQERDDDWIPVYEGAITRKSIYIKNNNPVTLFVGYYPVQKQGKEVINDLNKISRKDSWRTRYPRARLRQVDGRNVLEQLLVNGHGQKRLVWYWYHIGGHDTTNKYKAKLLQLSGLLTGDQGAFVIAVASGATDEISEAAEVLDRFTSEFERPIQSLVKSMNSRDLNVSAGTGVMKPGTGHFL
jgi:EpsI family protein